MSKALSRRSFIQNMTALGLAGSSSLLQSACGALKDRDEALGAAAQSGSVDDESYWEVVKRCFLLDPEITHVNNGTLGPMPGFLLQGVCDRLLEVARDPNCYHSAQPNMFHQLDEVREKAARFVNCSPEEIAFTRNTTEAMSLIAAGLTMKPGDEVLITDHEHVGGRACWEHKAKHEGIKVKQVTLPVPPKSEEQILERFEAAITPKTRVISVSHVTCTTGMRLPMKGISRMAREKGILVCVDGAQCLGWMKVDFADLDCDFYANSPHKWLFTPIGTGFLYVKKEMVPRIKASIISSGWDSLETAQKFETYGTRNLPEAIAMGDAIDLENAIGIERIEKRDYRLASKLREGLKRIPGVTMLSADSDELSSPLTSILLNRADGAKMDSAAVRKTFLEKYRIQVRHVGEANLGAIRLSTHIYNGPGCIDKVLLATEEIAKKGV